VANYKLMCLTKGKPRFPCSCLAASLWKSWFGRLGLGFSLVLAAAGLASAREPSVESAIALPGLSYTNSRITDAPWSIHVVQLDRANPQYQIHSVHAGARAIGLDTLSDQLGLIDPSLGTAVAAINGDFYLREKAYAGAPRGLEIMDGELLSAPSGGASFWIDALGEPHLENVTSQFQITWPDGATTEFGLNGERRADGVELYTQAIGLSTHTTGGRELILVQSEGSPWLPLRVGRSYTARVKEIIEAGDTPLAPNIMVLSLGPAVLPQSLPRLQSGAVLHISTGSQPALHGIKTAISGGPVLVHNGKQVRLKVSDSQLYQVTSMQEQHPRAAVGWNEKSLFLVEVDGRQKKLSVGMTLDELSTWLMKLGCKEAMNFDGGGSATLWFDGQVRNSPCDRMEREIANCLVIVRKNR
jgi:Phosphodiester glycosidase